MSYLRSNIACLNIIPKLLTVNGKFMDVMQLRTDNCL